MLLDAMLLDATLLDAMLRGAMLRGAMLLDAMLLDAMLLDAMLLDAMLLDAMLLDAMLRDAARGDGSEWTRMVAGAGRFVHGAASGIANRAILRGNERHARRARDGRASADERIEVRASIERHHVARSVTRLATLGAGAQYAIRAGLAFGQSRVPNVDNGALPVAESGNEVLARAENA
jgi:pentapeptide MXKDX repeat protein